MGAADAAILVTVPETVSLRDAERVKGLLEREGVAKPSFALNRATWRNGAKDAPVSFARCEEVLQLPLLGVVPEDPRVGALAAAGKLAISEETRAGAAFLRIARRLAGESVPVEYPRKPGFFQRLFFRE